MSRERRSTFRDVDYSDRHRLYGFNVPATDVDFVEYDRGWPKAIIEMKHEKAGKVEYLTDRNIICLRNLANMAGLPLFVARRAHDMSWVRVTAGNELACPFLGQPIPNETGSQMTEVEWVLFLYKIRGREPGPCAKAEINNLPPFVPTPWTGAA